MQHQCITNAKINNNTIDNNKLSENKYYSIAPAAPVERRNTLLLIIAILLIGLLNIYFAPIKYFLNDVAGFNSPNGCPLLTFTGIPCPFCGTGRVFSCITDLYLLKSFYYNPLGLLFYIIFGFSLGVILVLSIKKKKVVLKKPAIRLWYIPVLFLVIMWVLNILYGHHY